MGADLPEDRILRVDDADLGNLESGLVQAGLPNLPRSERRIQGHGFEIPRNHDQDVSGFRSIPPAARESFDTIPEDITEGGIPIGDHGAFQGACGTRDHNTAGP